MMIGPLPLAQPGAKGSAQTAEPGEHSGDQTSPFACHVNSAASFGNNAAQSNADASKTEPPQGQNEFTPPTAPAGGLLDAVAQGEGNTSNLQETTPGNARTKAPAGKIASNKTAPIPVEPEVPGGPAKMTGGAAPDSATPLVGSVDTSRNHPHSAATTDPEPAHPDRESDAAQFQASITGHMAIQNESPSSPPAAPSAAKFSDQPSARIQGTPIRQVHPDQDGPHALSAMTDNNADLTEGPEQSIAMSAATSALPSPTSDDARGPAVPVPHGQGVVRAEQSSLPAAPTPPATTPPDAPRPDTPISMADPDFVGQLGLRIARRMQEGQKELILRLSPAALGEITVRLETGKDGLSRLSFHADSIATLDLIRREAPALSHKLHDAGLKTDGQQFSFSGGQHGASGHDPRPQQSRPVRQATARYESHGITADARPITMPTQIAATGMIDMKA